MGLLMLSAWEEAGEAAFSRWFRAELFTPPYNNWYIGSVNEKFEPLPHPETTNPIESFNHTIKMFIPHAVSMSTFINEKLPLVLKHSAASYCGVKYDTSITQAQFLATNPIGRFTLEKAAKLVAETATMKIPNISKLKGKHLEDFYYLNTKSNIVNTSSKSNNNGEAVTNFRIKVNNSNIKKSIIICNTNHS